MLADGLELNETQRSELLAARNSANLPSPNLRAQQQHGLPMPTTSFIGRVQEIDSIISMLEDDRVRLITLTGPGGVGKTRIAIELAHLISDRYLHGAVLLISLQSVIPEWSSPPSPTDLEFPGKAIALSAMCWTWRCRVGKC